MEGARYFAIVGCRHYLGIGFLKPGIVVQLVKEPDNAYDGEAIAVYLIPIGQIGYVANSTDTVPRGCRSAGRLYDTFDQVGYGLVRFVLRDTAIAEFLDEDTVHYEIKVDMFDHTEAGG